jgi:molybdopterin-guanine dinucleotide biosynthesis protein B
MIIPRMKIFGFAGWSGSGKTTLIEKLIPLFVARGLTVSLVKHAHHSFDVDQPGKDSWRHRHAGCTEVLVSSSRRWALVHELRGAPEPGFEELVRNIAPCDLLLVEGFKREQLPKLEVYRAATGEALLHPQDADIVGIASDRKIATALPWMHLDDAPSIASFILRQVGLP